MYASEPCGTMNHAQCVHTSILSSARQRGSPFVGSTRASARCRRNVGSSPMPSTRWSVDRVVDVHVPQPARPRHRAESCTPPDTPTSAERTPSRRACASGARPRTGRPAPRTRRSGSQAAAPRSACARAARPALAATIPQAVALITLDSRTAPEYMAVPGGLWEMGGPGSEPECMSLNTGWSARARVRAREHRRLEQHPPPTPHVCRGAWAEAVHGRGAVSPPARARTPPRPRTRR